MSYLWEMPENQFTLKTGKGEKESNIYLVFLCKRCIICNQITDEESFLDGTIPATK